MKNLATWKERLVKITMSSDEIDKKYFKLKKRQKKKTGGLNKVIKEKTAQHREKQKKDNLEREKVIDAHEKNHPGVMTW